MKFVNPFNLLTRIVTYGGDPADWTNGAPGLENGSVPPVQAVVHAMQEIVAAIEAGGLTPDENDRTQLAQAMTALANAAVNNRARLISADTTINVPADFATLQEAHDSLYGAMISPDVYVTIQIAAGIHAIAAVRVWHPDGPRIKIVGAPLPGAFPIAADVAATIAATRTAVRARFATILTISGGSGIIVERGGLGLIDNILFDHDGTGAGSALGCVVAIEGRVTLGRVAVIGAAIAGGNGAGLAAEITGSIDAGPEFFIAHCDELARAHNRGRIWLDGSAAPNQRVLAYAHRGVAARGNGAIRIGGATVTNCDLWGAWVENEGSIEMAAGLTFSGNTVNVGSNGGRIDGKYAPHFGAPSATNSIVANEGGYVDLVGATGSLTCSPAANTAGNANSFVRIA